MSVESGRPDTATREQPMPIVADKAFKRTHRITWACPHDDAKASMTAGSRATAMQVAGMAWDFHQDRCEQGGTP